MSEEKRTSVSHQFEPVFDEHSRILILGTFPSVKSRENHFYYGHPQNRFWKLMARITCEEVPESIEEKKILLLRSGIAIWDVIASCRITGSSDSSIRDVVPTDLARVLEHSPIERIYANGTTAKKLYERFSQEQTGRPIIGLPSTSPANAAYSMDRLMETWGKILEKSNEM
ncbi:MAG: DNA-deoxyinosine glycosylase [Lachnospiraceae bacterium]|nr:DNA-deoxyinosine glycosylase [Lachnospiraceae bacterium]